MKNETMNAATLGLGFHKFDGNVPVDEVIKAIGADFKVREDRLVRLPEDVLEAALRGESITIKPEHLITSHKATVHDGDDKTIGIVGSDYGTVQNTSAFDILDLMCNAGMNENPLQIVSAGLVHNFDPYIQAKLPTSARIDGDKSETDFYVFCHTSHDGSSGLQIRFSPVRVICQNTFMMNVSSKLGMTFKHSKNVASRVDLTNPGNIKRIQEMVGRLGILQQDYIDRMNHLGSVPVDDKFINEYTMQLFISDEKLMQVARDNNYNLDLVDEASTRTKNLVTSFKNTLYSDDRGQDFARGTKLWLFNGTTNFTSNVASYGSARDNAYTRAEKRFDSMLGGQASKRIDKAMALLTA